MSNRTLVVSNVLVFIYQLLRSEQDRLRDREQEYRKLKDHYYVMRDIHATDMNKLKGENAQLKKELEDENKMRGNIPVAFVPQANPTHRPPVFVPRPGRSAPY